MLMALNIYGITVDFSFERRRESERILFRTLYCSARQGKSEKKCLEKRYLVLASQTLAKFRTSKRVEIYRQKRVAIIN